MRLDTVFRWQRDPAKGFSLVKAQGEWCITRDWGRARRSAAVLHSYALEPAEVRTAAFQFAQLGDLRFDKDALLIFVNAYGPLTREGLKRDAKEPVWQSQQFARRLYRALEAIAS